MLSALGTVQIRSGSRSGSGSRAGTPAWTPAVVPAVRSGPAWSPCAAASGALLFPTTPRAPLFVVHTPGRHYPAPLVRPGGRLAALAVR